MTLANDSVTITPGSGATIATHLASAKEYQVFMRANEDGHILGSRPMYVANIPNQVHVAAASTIHWDLFNADSTLIVRIASIRQRPDIVTAVTGVATAFNLRRTSAVGTGGTSITPWLNDTGDTALSANITCRSKPTGGATSSLILKPFQIHSEETNTGTLLIAAMGGYELVPSGLWLPGSYERGIVLRQNQGISVTQDTNSAAGNTGWEILFCVE